MMKMETVSDLYLTTFLLVLFIVPPSDCGHPLKHFCTPKVFILFTYKVNVYNVSFMHVHIKCVNVSSEFEGLHLKIKISVFVVLVVAGGPSLASNSVVSGLVPSSPIISPGTVPLSAGAIQP
jgi:hypothetical protein